MKQFSVAKRCINLTVHYLFTYLIYLKRNKISFFPEETEAVQLRMRMKQSYQDSKEIRLPSAVMNCSDEALKFCSQCFFFEGWGDCPLVWRHAALPLAWGRWYPDCSTSEPDCNDSSRTHARRHANKFHWHLQIAFYTSSRHFCPKWCTSSTL